MITPLELLILNMVLNPLQISLRRPPKSPGGGLEENYYDA
jgi:hypothetical protein